MRALLIIAAILLTGCGAAPTKATVDASVLPLDAAVADKCDIAPDAPDRATANMGQLLTFSDQLVGLYGECALRDSAKYAWIKSQGH